jgi:sulfoxide reductase heme-binding subunit YedZ
VVNLFGTATVSDPLNIWRISRIGLRPWQRAGAHRVTFKLSLLGLKPAIEIAKGSRLGEQVVLAAIALVATLTFLLLLSGPDIIWRLSMATAYAGLLYLAAALIIGPINVLRGAPNPLSINLRRDIGIVAGVLALAHTIVGLFVHLRGDPIQYFFYRSRAGIGGLRHDLWGAANDVGLFASLVILVLLTISNNLSIRTMGGARWKRIQRWSYVGAILVIVHGLLYQAVEKRTPVLVATMLIIAAAVTMVQLLGFRRRRK